jgi:hypothetical protein
VLGIRKEEAYFCLGIIFRTFLENKAEPRKEFVGINGLPFNIPAKIALK